MDASTQEAELKVLGINPMVNLPQRKMGSMTNVQSLTHEQSTRQSNIRSVNTQSLGGEPALQHTAQCIDDSSTVTGMTGLNNAFHQYSTQWSGTVSATPRNNLATKPTPMHAQTRIIRLL